MKGPAPGPQRWPTACRWPGHLIPAALPVNHAMSHHPADPEDPHGEPPPLGTSDAARQAILRKAEARMPAADVAMLRVAMGAADAARAAAARRARGAAAGPPPTP
jgi:hypothetical protein